MNEELYQRLVDRYTAVDLLDLLDISIEQFVEAFYDQITSCVEVLSELGFDPEDEE